LFDTSNGDGPQPNELPTKVPVRRGWVTMVDDHGRDTLEAVYEVHGTM
jgi:hypothetical protein